MKTFVLSKTQECEKVLSFPTMLDTQTIIVHFVFFASKFMCQLAKRFVSVIVRCECSSATNDLNVVGDCEMLALASLSITATLI